MKKILLIANYKPAGGGISVQVSLLHKNLCKEGVSAEIFSTEGNIFLRLFVLFKLMLKGKNFDIFHIHGCSYVGGFFPIMVGFFAGKILKKQIIVTYHGGGADDFFKKRKSFVRFFLTRTDINIVLSGFLGEIFNRYSIPFIVIPNIAEFSGEHFVERKTIRPNYISVRSLIKTYNVECIVRAFSIVQQKFSVAELTLLGDGDCRADLENLAKNLNLKNVRFLGRVENKNIYNYLSKADIFLSSSIVDNQPMSILEAYNAGLLVISSKVGGVPYMLEDNETGLLFESNNYEELAEKMIFAAENQELSKKMILNASKELEKYSWNNVKQELFAVYNITT